VRGYARFALACWYRYFVEQIPGPSIATAGDLPSNDRGLAGVQRAGCIAGGSKTVLDDPLAQAQLCTRLAHAADALACLRGVANQAYAGEPARQLALFRVCARMPAGGEAGCAAWFGRTFNVVTNGSFLRDGCPRLATATEACRVHLARANGAGRSSPSRNSVAGNAPGSWVASTKRRTRGAPIARPGDDRDAPARRRPGGRCSCARPQLTSGRGRRGRHERSPLYEVGEQRLAVVRPRPGAGAPPQPDEEAARARGCCSASARRSCARARSGKTLAELASDQGVSRDDLIAAVVQGLQSGPPGFVRNVSAEPATDLASIAANLVDGKGSAVRDPCRRWPEAMTCRNG
jgi:hypothetical protein